MTLFIDGDALPNILKPIIQRLIERQNLETVVVSNKRITIGKSKNVKYIIVDVEDNEADDKIIEMVKEGDLVITADIPLADRVITKKAHAIDHRGKLFSVDNIKSLLSMRNLMSEIRDCGETTKGPPPFSQKNAHEFANKLDQFFTKRS